MIETENDRERERGGMIYIERMIERERGGMRERMIERKARKGRV